MLKKSSKVVNQGETFQGNYTMETIGAPTNEDDDLLDQDDLMVVGKNGEARTSSQKELPQSQGHEVAKHSQQSQNLIKGKDPIFDVDHEVALTYFNLTHCQLLVFFFDRKKKKGRGGGGGLHLVNY